MAKNFEQLKNDLQSDAALLKEFQEAKIANDDTEGIIAFAAKKGYTITADEINNYKNNELSADELEKVAGGFDLMDDVVNKAVEELDDVTDVMEDVVKPAVCYTYIAVAKW